MPAFRTEEQLLRSFLEYACPTLWSRTKPRYVRTATESTCSDGRADWVWAGFNNKRPRKLHTEISDLLQQPTCSRILAVLKSVAHRREEFLQSISGVTPPTFRRSFTQLLDARLVSQVLDDCYVLGPAFRFPDMEVCSFEFKLDAWKRAFYQAKRYRSFSHRVFVVMPSHTVHRAAESIDIFRRFNIGLISHHADGTSERILISRKKDPCSRPRYIQAVGMLFA